MTVTVKRIGGSLAVVIPHSIANESGLSEGTALNVSNTAAGILFRSPKRRPRRSVAALAKQIQSAAYAVRHEELLSDSPVGREVG